MGLLRNLIDNIKTNLSKNTSTQKMKEDQQQALKVAEQAAADKKANEEAKQQQEAIFEKYPFVKEAQDAVVNWTINNPGQPVPPEIEQAYKDAVLRMEAMERGEVTTPTTDETTPVDTTPTEVLDEKPVEVGTTTNYDDTPVSENPAADANPDAAAAQAVDEEAAKRAAELGDYITAGQDLMKAGQEQYNQLHSYYNQQLAKYSGDEGKALAAQQGINNGTLVSQNAGNVAGNKAEQSARNLGANGAIANQLGNAADFSAFSKGLSSNIADQTAKANELNQSKVDAANTGMSQANEIYKQANDAYNQEVNKAYQQAELGQSIQGSNMGTVASILGGLGDMLAALGVGKNNL